MTLTHAHTRDRGTTPSHLIRAHDEACAFDIQRVYRTHQRPYAPAIQWAAHELQHTLQSRQWAQQPRHIINAMCSNPGPCHSTQAITQLRCARRPTRINDCSALIRRTTTDTRRAAALSHHFPLVATRATTTTKHSRRRRHGSAYRQASLVHWAALPATNSSLGPVVAHGLAKH